MKLIQDIYTNINEQAQATLPKGLFAQNIGRVYVFGGGVGGNQKEHGIPHFKLVLNDNTEFRIIIPIKKVKELTSVDVIILDNKTLKSKLKKDILVWMKSDSKIAESTLGIKISNIKYCASLWNTLNFGDDNISQINLKKL